MKQTQHQLNKARHMQKKVEQVIENRFGPIFARSLERYDRMIAMLRSLPTRCAVCGALTPTHKPNCTAQNVATLKQ